MKHLVQTYLPGLGLVGCVTAMAMLLSSWIPGPGSATLAVLCGMVLRFFLPAQGAWVPGVQWVEKKVLGFAVAMLGFGLDVEFLARAGWGAFIVLLVAVLACLFQGVVLTKVFRLEWNSGFLIAIGNTFCGASAIVASAAVIKAERKDIALSVGVISLLGTIGIFALPPYIRYFAMDVRDSALVVGGGLQAIGHVAAVGHALGEEVAELAMAFKMLRVVMLIPFLMLLGMMGNGTGKSARPPHYVIGFALAAFIRWLGLLPYEVAEGIGDMAHMLLVGIMAGLGLGIDLVSLVKQGLHAILVGTFSFLGLLMTLHGLTFLF